ncbi:LamG domain-containing protein [Actinoplanes sp. NPDC026623]|uniref:LamG domain-containing protein n=1 Tax=Actinoplanes sp. NPDC026623 TaxID=3155610 RepID=UPI0033E5FBD5
MGATLSVIPIGTAVQLAAPIGAAAAACPATSPAEAEAQRAAAACDGRVEILSARSEYGSSYANADGTTTMETSMSPVWVRRSGNKWAKVDITLRKAADGSIEPVASPSPVRFSAGGTGPAVSFQAGGAEMTLGWKGKLPSPTVNGATAVYADVLPDVDLALTATVGGFKHVLVVKNATAAKNPALREIRFKVGGDVTPAPTRDGHVRFATSKNRTVAVTSTASAWDSSVLAGVAGPVVPAQARSLAATEPDPELVSSAARPGAAAVSRPLEVTAGQGDLVVTATGGLLDDPATVYPVYIDPQIGPASSKWAYANSANKDWDVDGMGWVGINPYDGVRYRSFFDFPSTSGSLTWKGKSILGASMNIWVDHTWSCDDTWTHMYRPSGAITAGNGARMSWSTRPLGSSATWLASAASHANEAGGCGGSTAQPDQLVSFTGTTLINDIATAAKGGWNTYAVGLCACNTSNEYESSQDRWKKFFTTTTTGGHGAPALSVTFNSKPGVPANLHPYSGVACGGAIGTTSPVLQAQYVDADTADTLTSTFEWKVLGATTATAVAGPSKPANNTGSITLNLGVTAEGKTYTFRVMTNDKHANSDWSGWCNFTVNASAPLPPDVTSTIYSPCEPSALESCTAAGGPGVSGPFKIAQPASDPKKVNVVSYTYGWISPPTNTVPVTGGALFGPTDLTPPRYGLNTLYAFSKNQAGIASPIRTYTFLVDSPSAAVASYPLDDLRQHGLTDQVSGTALTGTNVNWTQDARYLGASAATFGLGADASTAGPVVDTSKSFSVSAWVRLTDTSNAYRVVAAQDGAAGSGFIIYNTKDAKSWGFVVYDADSATSSAGTFVYAPATFGVWTHLTAVYDAKEKRVSIYSNGALSGSATRAVAPWAAGGKTHIGSARGMIQGPGQIADVRFYNRVLTTDDLWGTTADPGAGVQSTTGILAPMQVGSWDFSGGMDCYCDSVLDGAYFGRSMTLDAGWVNAPPSAQFVLGGHDYNDALQTDGLDGYADTGTGVLRTDQSFTVSAWVNMTQPGAQKRVVMSQGGSFSLYWDQVSQKWAFGVANPDGSVTTALSATTAKTDDWVHLAGVFDAGSGEVALYVDGVKQPVATGGKGSFAAAGLRLGALPTGSFYGGLIDEVKVYQGTMSAREIAGLHED